MEVVIAQVRVRVSTLFDGLGPRESVKCNKFEQRTLSGAPGHQLRKNDLVACMADRGTLACCELEALRVKDSVTIR